LLLVEIVQLHATLCLRGGILPPVFASSLASLADLPAKACAVTAIWPRNVLPNAVYTPIAAMATSATTMMYSVIPWPSCLWFRFMCPSPVKW
jgi:hypothetical protein